jgi:hypothetical protein
MVARSGARLCWATLALTLGSVGKAQVQPAAVVRTGTWAYGGTATGSDAVFSDATRQPLVILRCTRVTRKISIIIRSAPAASLLLSTSSASRTLPAVYNAATSELTAEVAAFDNLLDALAFSKGRISVTVPGSAPIILPNWPEPTRAIEDCRN